jgi:hypothetical protein
MRASKPAGKHRRLQFIECENDLNAMIDAAKFADLVLLLIDGGYGFEMETFEFLNILQVSACALSFSFLYSAPKGSQPLTCRGIVSRGVIDGGHDWGMKAKACNG